MKRESVYMIRKSIALLVLLFPALLCAQTIVSGTIVDANLNPYANGTVSAYYLPSTGQGSPFTVNGTTNSVGTFTITLKSAGAYQFTVCAMPVNIGPLANPTPTQICAYSSPIQISGPTQDVSTPINAAAPLLGPKINSSNGNLPLATSQGQLPAATGAGNTYAAQSKPAINVLDRGVDCSGSSDTSTALNAVFSSINQTEVDFPYNCQMRVDNRVVIQGQSGWVLKAMGEKPGVGGLGGPSIFGCNGSAGPVLYINRSGYGRIDGLGVYPKGSCTSSFTGSVQIDSTGAPGVTTHNIRLENMALTSSPQGTAIAGYFGVSITDGGRQNGEMIRIRNTWINCQNSTSSIGIDLENGTSDKDLFESNNIASCFIGIKHGGGNATIRDNLFSSTGNFSVFGNGGGAIWIGSCSSGPINIEDNEADTIGQFINESNDINPNGCNAGVNVIRNDIGVADYDTSKFPINLGTINSVFIVFGNQINLVQDPTSTVIGSNSNSPHGPLGVIYEWGNSLQNSHGAVFGWCCQVPGFQSGELRFNGFPGGQYSSIDQMYLNNEYNNGWASPMVVWRNKNNPVVNDDWAIQSIAAGNVSSALLIKHQLGATTGFLGFDGIAAGFKAGQIVAVPTPALGVIGGSGAVTYTYSVVAFTADGGSVASPTNTIVNSVAFGLLTTSLYNQLQWTPAPGAVKYCIFRTVGGSTQGNIGCVSALLIAADTPQFNYTINGAQNAGPLYQFRDTGLAGDGAVLPAINTTGAIVALNGVHDSLGRSYGGVIASGSTALNTNLIASQACDSVVTVTANGVLATDVLDKSLNGDVTGVTGYAPLTSGTLTIYTYPSANAVNFKVCNSTSAGITPGAVTLNWHVVRPE